MCETSLLLFGAMFGDNVKITFPNSLLFLMVIVLHTQKAILDVIFKNNRINIRPLLEYKPGVCMFTWYCLIMYCETKKNQKQSRGLLMYLSICDFGQALFFVLSPVMAAQDVACATGMAQFGIFIAQCSFFW